MRCAGSEWGHKGSPRVPASPFNDGSECTRAASWPACHPFASQLGRCVCGSQPRSNGMHSKPAKRGGHDDLLAASGVLRRGELWGPPVCISHESGSPNACWHSSGVPLPALCCLVSRMGCPPSARLSPFRGAALRVFRHVALVLLRKGWSIQWLDPTSFTSQLAGIGLPLRWRLMADEDVTSGPLASSATLSWSGLLLHQGPPTLSAELRRTVCGEYLDAADSWLVSDPMWRWESLSHPTDPALDPLGVISGPPLLAVLLAHTTHTPASRLLCVGGSLLPLRSPPGPPAAHAPYPPSAGHDANPSPIPGCVAVTLCCGSPVSSPNCAGLRQALVPAPYPDQSRWDVPPPLLLSESPEKIDHSTTPEG